MNIVKQISVPKPNINFQVAETKQYQSYTPYNGGVIISGYREGEYWIVRREPNGNILWDSLSLNIPADTLR